MNSNYHHPSSERGSVFFYIMIAIALLVSLTYAISRGSGDGTNIFTDQQAKAAATEIIEYGNAVANAVQKLRLRGCRDTQFDFSNSVWTNNNGSITIASGHNPTSTSDCSVFDISAGGIEPVVLNTDFFNDNVNPSYSKSGSARIRIANIPEIGSSESELVYQVAEVNDPVCIKINDLLNVANVNNLPPKFNEHFSEYDGTYPAQTALDDINGAITGKMAFCVERDGFDNNKYIQVLIAR